MGPFDILSISASALSAERQRSEVIAANMANAETTHTDGRWSFHAERGGFLFRKQRFLSSRLRERRSQRLVRRLDRSAFHRSSKIKLRR